MYSLTDPELGKLANLEVRGRIVPCGSDDLWSADHSTVVEFGSELRLTTTVTWTRIPDDDSAVSPPVIRVVRGSLRFVGDRLVDPLKPDASETPTVDVGPHP